MITIQKDKFQQFIHLLKLKKRGLSQINSNDNNNINVDNQSDYTNDELSYQQLQAIQEDAQMAFQNQMINEGIVPQSHVMSAFQRRKRFGNNQNANNGSRSSKHGSQQRKRSNNNNNNHQNNRSNRGNTNSNSANQSGKFNAGGGGGGGGDSSDDENNKDNSNKDNNKDAHNFDSDSESNDSDAGITTGLTNKSSSKDLLKIIATSVQLLAPP